MEPKTKDSNNVEVDLQPALASPLKEQLSTIAMLETRRQGSKELKKDLQAETFQSGMESAANLMLGAGSLLSGITSLIGGGAGVVGGVIGAVFSLAGKIIGTVMSMKKANAAAKDEDAEKERKLTLARSIIKQMAALPDAPGSSLEDAISVAKGTGNKKIPRDTMHTIDQYVGAYLGASASGINLVDIYYAIKQGGFGTQKDDGSNKSAAESMADMYANLTFS